MARRYISTAWQFTAPWLQCRAMLRRQLCVGVYDVIKFKSTRNIHWVVKKESRIQLKNRIKFIRVTFTLKETQWFIGSQVCNMNNSDCCWIMWLLIRSVKTYEIYLIDCWHSFAHRNRHEPSTSQWQIQIHWETLLISLLIQFPGAREQFMRAAVWIISHNILHYHHERLPISCWGSCLDPSCSGPADFY